MPRTKFFAEKAVSTHTATEEFVSLNAATEILGNGYSRSSILRRIDSGEWVEGNHWVDVRLRGAKKRIIQINLTVVRSGLSTPASKR